jgi:tetratricopeptide (TPR) repeat protein
VALPVRVALLAIAALAIAACAADAGPSWRFRRAEQLHAEGQHEEAVRLTEQEIAWNATTPSPELVELHISILRSLGRNEEANAYYRFADRYFTDVETDDPDRALFGHECSRHQPGYDLISSWGRPEKRDYEIGRVVVTFAVDERGAIRDIDVRSARDPSSAWAGIDAVASAKIRPGRLAERRSSDPGGFPIALCFTKNYDPLETPLDPGGDSIRGSELGGD